MKTNNLVNISDISIDCNLKKEQRIKKFLDKIENPYAFKVGEVEVAISFAPEGERLQDKMEHYFEGMIL